ncbi:hypothetical protein [Ruminococcus sp. NK3A76]|uniref:O-antigen ligase family protein n=1 Tax=Ruminococcus sp. NK3A76 TaxID=877411 RepID=UPI00048F92AD|nr:hypothetical protein [Ruminococcus sp. NK3A76]
MEAKKHLFGSTEKSDFILNMTKESTQKMMGMFSIISMWVLALCALPYYLTKDTIRETEEVNGFVVTHYMTENTVIIMSTVLIAIGFLCGLMFLIAKMKEEVTLKNKKGLVTLVLFVAMSFVTLMSAVSLRAGFFGHSYRNDGFLQFLACCGFVLMGMLVTGETWRRRFCDNLVAIGASQALFGILQVVFPKLPNYFNELFLGFPAGLTNENVNDRGYLMDAYPCATGLLCSPQALAAVLTVIFAFAAAGVMYAKGGKRKVLYLAACGLMAAASILTHILPGLIGIPCVLGVLLVIEIIRLARKNVLWSKKALENSIVWCVIAIAISGAVFLGFKLGGGIELRDEDVIFTETFTRLSTSYHVRSNTDMNIYADYRNVGSAAVTYELDQKKYFGLGQDNLDTMYGVVTGFRNDRTYNDYLDMILQRGVITFATYCLFLLYALYNGVKATVAFYKKQQPFYGAAALAGMIGYLVVMFWNTSGPTLTYYLYLCIGMAVMYGEQKALSPKEKKQAARQKAAKSK